ncbi:MAG TPA: ScbR family autoregulator-binding transcription factor [Pseudonocardiaceae bacterium]|nr:ScbR family autoregulator-binding transcription factor [Pseudonocardiaceae bacterium]
MSGGRVVAARREPAGAGAATAPTERLQGRARVTRQALLVAAATRFAEVGYHGTSLSEVIAASQVTKGALYFHFASKQALADAVVAEMVARWRVMVAEVNARGLDPLWSLLAQTDEVVVRKIEDPIARGGIQLVTDPGVVCAEAATHYLYGEAAAKEQLTAAAEGGLLRSGVDPAQIARVVVSMITGSNLLCDLFRGHNYLWEAVTELWQGLLPAIATDPWLERWRAVDWPRRPMPVISGFSGPLH